MPASPYLKKTLVSVVIITRDARDLLAKCLSSLNSRDRYELEIIVIDNGSCDGTPEMIRRDYPRAILLRNDRNRGVAPARNQGLRIARGDYIMILDDDAYLTGNAIVDFIEFMERNPDAGLCGPRIDDGAGRLTPSCKRFPTPLSFLFNRYPRLSFLDRMKALDRHLMKDWDHKNLAPVDYVIGACQFIRRKTFVTVGMLDDRIFYGPEDIDYCIRIWENGWRVFYLPAITAVHTPRRITKSRFFSKLTWRHFTAIAYFFGKHRLHILRLISRSNDRVLFST